MLSTKQLTARYGKPGTETNLVMINLPYPMRIAWDLKKSVNTIRCHELIADKLLAVFSELLQHYGYAEIQRLGIDLFGGCYNFRPKRGTEKRYNALMKSGNIEEAYELLSNHSWGTAIDVDPARNQLHETAKTARFARPEYKPMIDIFYKHGFISLGKEKNFDWMHFEIGS
jgi:hypothetical protein